MKNLLLLSISLVLVISCNSIDKEIKSEDVIFLNDSNTFVLKKNQKLATGIIVYKKLNANNEEYLESKKRVYNGKLSGFSYEYFNNGNVKAEMFYKEGKLDSISKHYSFEGVLEIEEYYKNGLKDSISKTFGKNGIQKKEKYYKNGIEIKSYDFDKNGVKIIPVIEKLELLAIETGFTKYTDFNSFQFLYTPTVITKWKNITNEVIDETMEIEVVFTSKEEQIGSGSEFLIASFKTPLNPGISIQSSINAGVGYSNYNSIFNADVECTIYVNDLLYKKIDINNKFLTSTRL